ncbi:MAG TPA: response regulator [Phycisphaerae bacterium]|jgi:DNA-binding response OmpR family regulator|nr:response regulator [Phycisphaerae bacterium]
MSTASAKTILTVDDESHILHVVSLKLKNAGFNVFTAPDAEEAFETAQTTPLDLVITDFQMPGMTGLELARKLHAEPGKKHLPVMLLTAHGLALEQVELAQAGVTACLSKPFSPRDLLAKVHELLDARDAATASKEAHVA